MGASTIWGLSGFSAWEPAPPEVCQGSLHGSQHHLGSLHESQHHHQAVQEKTPEYHNTEYTTTLVLHTATYYAEHARVNMHYHGSLWWSICSSSW